MTFMTAYVLCFSVFGALYLQLSLKLFGPGPPVGTYREAHVLGAGPVAHHALEKVRVEADLPRRPLSSEPEEKVPYQPHIQPKERTRKRWTERRQNACATRIESVKGRDD
jgi:hypothetical protein